MSTAVQQRNAQKALAELYRLVDEYVPKPGASPSEVREMERQYYTHFPAAMATFRRTVVGLAAGGGITGVPIGGSPARGAKAGYFMMRTFDGAPAYFMRRNDDCLQAAVATVLSIAPHKIPLPAINAMIYAGRDVEEVGNVFDAQFDQWADRQGIRIAVHPTASTVHPPTRGKWVAVAPNARTTHCLICLGGQVIHDPLAVLPSTPDELGDLADTIEFGFTIERS